MKVGVTGDGIDEVGVTGDGIDESRCDGRWYR